MVASWWLGRKKCSYEFRCRYEHCGGHKCFRNALPGWTTCKLHRKSGQKRQLRLEVEE